MDTILLWCLAIFLAYVWVAPDYIDGCQDVCCTRRFYDCQDYQENGHNLSSVYRISPVGMFTGYDVFCDLTRDDGGWIVIQRRIDGSLDFNRIWKSYEDGFGDPTHEYWIGLLPLWRLLIQGHYQLRIDVEDWDSTTKYALYDYFIIGGPVEKYKLQARRYSGTAGNSLAGHNGKKFSTRDNDNDLNSSLHCAEIRGGGWWYSKCGPSSLNGKYITHNETSGTAGIRWIKWKPASYSFKSTEMRIRRA